MADLKLKERSFVSQPTLSAQLKKLEEYLGVQLIERAPKRVALTAAGEAIVERARRILESSEEIVELARGHRDPLAGRLKLALLPTIGPYLLPNVAGKLRKSLPRLELMLYEYQTDVMLEKLLAGEIDVGILALPVAMDGLESYELYKEPFMVAMPAGHRLSGRASIKIEDLSHETLLLLEDGHCLRDQALEICSGADLHEKQDFRATSLETLRQMVAAGVGITLLPELAGRGAYGAARGVLCRRAPSARCGANRARAAQPSWRSRSRSGAMRCESRSEGSL